MELNSFIYLIKSKISTILVFVAVFFVLGMILTLSQPLKYSSNLRLLVVQNSSGASDSYTTTRTNEYISEILSKVAYSTSFFNQTMASGLNIDVNYFGSNPKKISKTWAKTIDVRPVNNTGIIAVAAYHPNRDQAEKIARSVGNVLITQNSTYHGLGDKISVKLLDEPMTSRYPVKPNLILNAILSLILGLVFTLAFIYLFPDSNLFKKKYLINNNWQENNAQFNHLNLHNQQAEDEAFHLVEETLPLEADFVQNEAPKIDWHKDF